MDIIILILVIVIVLLGYFFYRAMIDYQAVVGERDALLDICRGMESDLVAVTSQLKQVRVSIDLLENEYSQYRTSSDDVIDKLIGQASII